jgi:hypothetical protein
MEPRIRYGRKTDVPSPVAETVKRPVEPDAYWYAPQFAG